MLKYHLEVRQVAIWLNKEVNVGKDVTITSQKGAGLIIYSNKSTDSGYQTGESTGVVINVAGTWTTDLYTVSVHGQVTEGDDSNPVINVSEGEFTSNSTIAFYASGYGEWNIKGGKITGADAFKYRTGKVVIEGNASLIGKKKVSAPTGTSGGAATGSAFVFSKDVRTPIDVNASTNVKFNGGTFKSDSADGYAIYFESLARVKDEEAVIEFNSGSYASKGKKAAIGFASDVTNDVEDFLKNHEGIVNGGEYTNDITTSLGNYPASAIAEKLAKGIELKTEDGKVVVGNGNTTAGEPTPGEPGTTEPGETGDGNQGPTDNVKNPETNDNILVYAGLGLVSLASVAFTARKRED